MVVTGVVYCIDRSSIERKYGILRFVILETKQIKAIINPYTVLIPLYFVPGHWLVVLRVRVIGGKIVQQKELASSPVRIIVTCLISST